MEQQDITALSAEFKDSQKILVALGDENRQHIILEMMQMNNCPGARVGDITEKSNLSRPAVSHHLQILKDAGIVKMHREGTRNYYYFDEKSRSLRQLLDMLTHVNSILENMPDRDSTDE